MITTTGPMNFDNIGGGAAREKFEDELVKVLKNCLDPNTPPKKRRTIIMRVDITPNEQRDRATMVISTKAVLVEPKTFESMIFIGADKDGSPEAREVLSNEAQGRLITGPVIGQKGAVQ